jgi:hypothetical protein
MARGLELLLSAILLAGIYATMAYGLGLIYGVLRIVNLNHGGMIMTGAYLGWWLHEKGKLDPYLGLPIVAVACFALGRQAAFSPFFSSSGCGWSSETRHISNSPGMIRSSLPSIRRRRWSFSVPPFP